MDTRKNFIKYTFFNMLSMIGTSCYVLADTLFISNGVGLNGLTALNLTLPVYSLIFAVGSLLGVGGATRFSILSAQNHHREASQYFTQTLLLTIIISIPFLIGGLFFAQPIVRLLGADYKVVNLATLYLQTFIIFTPFFIFEHIVLTFIRNDHNPRLASIAMLCATMFNILFDYILVYPCHLGMFGAALATGISPIVALCICSLHFIQKKNHFCIEKCFLKRSQIKHIIQIGIPSFITELSGGIVVFSFNNVVFHLGGNTAVASYGIISNLAIVVTSLYTGIAQGIQPLLSQSYAKKEYHTTQVYLRYAYVLSFIISCFIYVCILLFPQEIIAFFNSEKNLFIFKIAKMGLLIYFSGFFFVGMNMISTSYFASIEKIKPSFIISLLRSGVIIIPLILILQFIGLNGVWASFPITELCITIIVLVLNKK